jgi:hypothetical protein
MGNYRVTNHGNDDLKVHLIGVLSRSIYYQVL